MIIAKIVLFLAIHVYNQIKIVPLVLGIDYYLIALALKDIMMTVSVYNAKNAIIIAESVLIILIIA
jgi:hypothetical protein